MRFPRFIQPLGLSDPAEELDERFNDVPSVDLTVEMEEFDGDGDGGGGGEEGGGDGEFPRVFSSDLLPFDPFEPLDTFELFDTLELLDP